MKQTVLDAILAARRERKALVLRTQLWDGKQDLIGEDDPRDGAETAALESAFGGKSAVVATPHGEVFLQAFVPEPRLFVIGATHIGQILVRLAREAGLDTTIVDPRTAFASTERFGDAKLITEWPGEALTAAGLDRRSAVITLAHNEGIDDEALEAALKSECFYVGALGSRRNHAKRIERLKARGLSDEQIARIKAPIGLRIGATTPAEIAFSIMGQVIAVLRHAEPS